MKPSAVGEYLTAPECISFSSVCCTERFKTKFVSSPINLYRSYHWKVKVKFSRYRPGVAQRVGRGIALLVHYRGTRRGWVVSSTPRSHFTPGEDPVSILQEAGWTPGPVWTGEKSRPHRDSISNRPARSQLLYRLRYQAHFVHINSKWESGKLRWWYCTVQKKRGSGSSCRLSNWTSHDSPSRLLVHSTAVFRLRFTACVHTAYLVLQSIIFRNDTIIIQQ